MFESNEVLAKGLLISHGFYWFWDETGADTYGPYTTQKSAVKNLKVYYSSLEKPKWHQYIWRELLGYPQMKTNDLDLDGDHLVNVQALVMRDDRSGSSTLIKLKRSLEQPDTGVP